MISNSDVAKRQPEGAVFHSDWDNFDQLVSDVYGAESVHTAVGIYLHDLGFCTDAEAPTPMTQDCHIDTQPKKKQRAFKSTVQELSSYYERKRSEPALLASSSSDMTTSIHEDQTSSDTNLIWVFTRRINSDEHIKPGLSGWVSATGHLPKCLTIIGYYPMINATITDLKTIQECLRCSQE